MPTTARRFFVAIAATMMLACAHREWRPKFDARCDCEGATSEERTTVASDTSTPAAHSDPRTDWFALVRARLQGDGIEPSSLTFHDESDFYGKPVRVLFDAHRDEAAAAASAAAQSVAHDLSPELAALRREMLLMQKTGDADATAEAKTALWLHFDEGMALVHEEAMNAARETIPLPKDQVLIACHLAQPYEIKFKPSTPKILHVCDVLTTVRLDRFRAARDAYLEELVSPIVAEHRKRMIAVMNR